VLVEAVERGVLIRRLLDDPFALRVSIGSASVRAVRRLAKR
jgi:hypothetical protein